MVFSPLGSNMDCKEQPLKIAESIAVKPNIENSGNCAIIELYENTPVPRGKRNALGTVFAYNTLIRKFDEDSLAFTSVASIGNYAFANMAQRIYIRLPYATTIGGGDAANYAVFMNNYATVVRIDAATRVRSVFSTTNGHTMVVTTPSVPTATCRFISSTIYVLDELVDSYKAASQWKDNTIRPISQLPTYMPDCPWLDDLRENGLID